MKHSLDEPRVLLLLRIIGGVEGTKTPDRWKVQKTAFLAEVKMQEARIGGLDYEFLKDRDGPLAIDIYRDLEYLIDAGYVASDYDPKLTPEGKRFLESMKELYDMNEDIVSPVDDTIQFVADKSSNELREMTHQMEIMAGGEVFKIHDLQPYYSIIQPLPKAFQKKKFKMTPDWKQTLEILGSKESRESLKKRVETCSTNDFLPLDQVLK